MNIEKLAKHLKEFTLDEIEMIAECDCKTELEQLLNEGKIAFEQGLYKYVEIFKEKTFELYPKPELKINKKVLFQDVALSYITNKKLTKDTLKGYKSQLKYNILPYFGDIQISKITYEMIVDFMQKMYDFDLTKIKDYNLSTVFLTNLMTSLEQNNCKHITALNGKDEAICFNKRAFEIVKMSTEGKALGLSDLFEKYLSNDLADDYEDYIY